MQNLLAKIILNNQDFIFNKKLIKRDYIIPNTEHITVLIGIRRCGKTHTLYSLAQQHKKEEVLFLDFEDERLLPINNLDNFDLIIDSYKKIYPDKLPILFFDEIQNLKNWHFYLKRLHVQGYKIHVTGSNANLISREIATFLTGRSLETIIYPFSFKEFLSLKEISFTAKDKITKIPQINNLFEEYLMFGGFPEVIKVESNEKRIVAQNIYNMLFYKDLIVKYDKDEYLIKLIANKICENITKEFSISSLANKIKPIYKTSATTVIEYFNLLPNPFLTVNIYQYRTSFIARQSKRKTYLADNSFIFLNRITTDKSRLFENLVFNYLQRENGDLFYYKTTNQKEVDFFIKTTNSKQLIQASINLGNQDTKKREIKALLKAMDEQNLNIGYIYTLNETEEINIKDKRIIVMPLWKVLLN